MLCAMQGRAARAKAMGRKAKTWKKENETNWKCGDSTGGFFECFEVRRGINGGKNEEGDGVSIYIRK